MKYSELFLRCIKSTFNLEGGYVNDPRDFGGETYKGVARNPWEGKCKVADSIFEIWDAIKSELRAGVGFNANEFDNLANKNEELQDLIHRFYYTHFWEYLEKDYTSGLDDKIKILIFDFGVNAGTRTAIKSFQRSLEVNADGVFGKNSLARYKNFSVDHVMVRYATEKTLSRLKFRSWNDHKKGWLRRDAANLIYASEYKEV